MPGMDPCYMIPPTVPITGTIYPGAVFNMNIPTNQKVYDILVSYQGHSRFHYNCAAIGPSPSYPAPLVGTCSSAPGVTTMNIDWGRSFEGPNGWNYSYKIQAAMAP